MDKSLSGMRRINGRNQHILQKGVCQKGKPRGKNKLIMRSYIKQLRDHNVWLMRFAIALIKRINKQQRIINKLKNGVK